MLHQLLPILPPPLSARFELFFPSSSSALPRTPPLTFVIPSELPVLIALHTCLMSLGNAKILKLPPSLVAIACMSLTVANAAAACVLLNSFYVLQLFLKTEIWLHHLLRSPLVLTNCFLGSVLIVYSFNSSSYNL